MKERLLTVDAREAKGLHDGAITRIVRLPLLHDSNPGDLTLPSYYNRVHVGYHYYDEENPPAFGAMFHCDKGGEVFVESPFGAASVAGEWLRAVCEPGEPCEHRGCLSHVTHVCEVCGRGWAGILLDVTDVRVIRVQEISEDDARAFGARQDRAYWLGGIHPVKGSLQCWNTHAEAVLAFIEPDSDKRGRGANPWIWLGTVAKVEANSAPADYRGRKVVRQLPADSPYPPEEGY